MFLYLFQGPGGGGGTLAQIFDSMIDVRHERRHNYAGFECSFIIWVLTGYPSVSKQESSFQQQEFH